MIEYALSRCRRTGFVLQFNSLLLATPSSAMIVDDPIPQPILTSVRSRFRATLECLPLPLGDLGCALLERLPPQQWTMEWALPYWLGRTLHLSADVSTSLILSNLFGLAYIRLQDDLIDGETAETDRISTILLAHQFFREAILNYHEFFDTDSAFWSYFRLWLDNWLAATLHSSAPGLAGWTEYGEQDYLRLAERGAPLKICCAAACLLANRADAIAGLSAALDHTLAAMVLLDHWHDWTSDLASGRYNTFVASCSDLPQGPANRDANSARVMETIYSGDYGRSYLERVQENLARAKDVTLAIDLPQLADYLITLEARAAAYYDSFRAEHHRAVRDVAEKLFGPLYP